MKSITRVAVTALAMAGALVIGLNMASASSSPPTPPAIPADTGRVMTPSVVTLQAQQESLFRPVTPCRVADTRQVGGPLGNNGARSFYVGGTGGFTGQGGKSGGCGVPSNAVGVAAVIAAVKPSAGGYFLAYPAGSAAPNSSVLNYSATTTSSGVTLPLNSNGGQGLTVRNYGGPTQLTVDVQGYYISQIQALINSDASVSSRTTRIVSTSHAGTGFYYVTLDRPARQCAPSAATYNLYRYASVGLSSSSTPNTISISVWTLDATTHKEVPTDFPFFLTVTC